MKPFALSILFALTLTACAANAALKPGDTAPDFTTEASLGGKIFAFSLAEALKKGPVVLYFYPAAFTSGCTVEAHDFADAVDDYRALGALVVGVSHDNIDTLTKFSVSECRSKFAVASDADGKIMAAYGAVMSPLLSVSNRTSYVITPNDKILYTYSALNPDEHVSNTLRALQVWSEQKTSKQTMSP